MGVTPSVPVKANSGVRARVPAAGKVLEGDDKPTLLREDVHYLHYITIITLHYTFVQDAKLLFSSVLQESSVLDSHSFSGTKIPVLLPGPRPCFSGIFLKINVGKQ